MTVNRPTLHRQRGLTLVELMISLTLGLLVISAVSSLFLSNQKTWRGQDERSQVQENAREAMNVIGHAIKHSGRIDPRPGLNNGQDLLNVTVPGGVTVRGFTVAQALAVQNDQIVSGMTAANGLGAISGTRSDVLTLGYEPDLLFNDYPVRTENASAVDTVSRSVRDCLGTRTATTESVVTNRFYVDADQGADGKWRPALKCTATYVYRHADGTTTSESFTGVVANNIERLQVLLGVDTNGDGQPESFAPASPTLNMRNVVALRVALLARSNPITDRPPAAATPTFNMFGGFYALSPMAALDTGTSVQPLSAVTYCNAANPCWIRQVYATTFTLRNRFP